MVHSYREKTITSKEERSQSQLCAAISNFDRWKLLTSDTSRRISVHAQNVILFSYHVLRVIGASSASPVVELHASYRSASVLRSPHISAEDLTTRHSAQQTTEKVFGCNSYCIILGTP